MDESLINKLFVGNALTKLKHIDDDCIDLVILKKITNTPDLCFILSLTCTTPETTHAER